MWNRWQDPETGTFLSEDPARDGDNWYSYAYSSPLNCVDPTGLEPHGPGIADGYGGPGTFGGNGGDYHVSSTTTYTPNPDGTIRAYDETFDSKGKKDGAFEETKPAVGPPDPTPPAPGPEKGGITEEGNNSPDTDKPKAGTETGPGSTGPGAGIVADAVKQGWKVISVWDSTRIVPPDNRDLLSKIFVYDPTYSIGFEVLPDGRLREPQVIAGGGALEWASPEGFAKGAALLLPAARQSLLGIAENPKLKNLVSVLFRKGAKAGSGSTADAIRFELRTGTLLSPKGHFQKGLEMRTALLRLLASGELSEKEASLAKSLLIDLQNALSGM